MGLTISDDELEEIKPLKESEDKGVIITPDTRGRKPEGENKPQEVREIIANDAIDLTPKVAAQIHGVDVTSVRNYSNGDVVAPDVRLRIIDRKNGIADLAITKLMDTLNLIDPSDADNVKDKMRILNGLTSLVDKVTTKAEEAKPQVHLHMWSPQQKTEKDYPVIDV